MASRFKNFRVLPILTAWFLAVSFAALMLLVFVSVGALETSDGTAETFWVALAILLGFAAAGFIVGVWTDVRPGVAAIGVTACSLVAWFALNLFFGEPTGQAAWFELPLTAGVALVLVQALAVLVGARIGARV